MSDSRAASPRKSVFGRAIQTFAASKAGGFYFVHVVTHIDPWVLKRTKGRFSTAIGQPILLVEHVGAKSGQARETALFYGTDGATILLVASKAGAPKNPAWYHNLKANPDCSVLARGRSGRYRARELEGEERERSWQIVAGLYPGYDVYQTRTGGRIIPLLALEPISD